MLSFISTVTEPADKDSMSSWQSDWTANPCHQTDDSWASFSHDPDREEIASGQWWPQTAGEDKAKDFNAVSYDFKVHFNDFTSLMLFPWSLNVCFCGDSCSLLGEVTVLSACLCLFN